MSGNLSFLVIPTLGYAIHARLQAAGRLDAFRRRMFRTWLICFTLTEIGRNLYRPLAYSRGWNDFAIADTLGNSLGTLTVVFFALTLFGRRESRDVPVILLVMVGMVVYELCNGFLGRPVDPLDIAATVAFGVVAIGLYAMLRGPNDSDPGFSPGLPRRRSGTHATSGKNLPDPQHGSVRIGL